MSKNLIIAFFLLICIGFQATAQTIVRKFQKIPIEGVDALAEVVQHASENENCIFLLGDNTYNSSKIIVEIEASGKGIPRRILDGLMDAGEFDLDFSIIEETLVLKNHSEIYFRIQNEKYTIKLLYKVSVPKQMADLFGIASEPGIAANN